MAQIGAKTRKPCAKSALSRGFSAEEFSAPALAGILSLNYLTASIMIGLVKCARCVVLIRKKLQETRSVSLQTLPLGH